MKYLLDTCAWLTLLNSPESMSGDAQDLLKKPIVYPVALATISIWEVAKKESLGKLKLNKPCQAWLSEALSIQGFELIPITHEIAWQSSHLKGVFHKDPADQLIVATAQLRDLTVITSDRKILEYEYVSALQM